jgi:hypothetical protein
MSSIALGVSPCRPYVMGMAWTLDARIPVSFGAWPHAGSRAAWLGAGPAPPDAVAALPVGEAHLAGCACCAGRTPAAEALDRLFQARVAAPAPGSTRSWWSPRRPWQWPRRCARIR